MSGPLSFWWTNGNIQMILCTKKFLINLLHTPSRIHQLCIESDDYWSKLAIEAIEFHLTHGMSHLNEPYSLYIKCQFKINFTQKGRPKSGDNL